jgi:hypothetical protein
MRNTIPSSVSGRGSPKICASFRGNPPVKALHSRRALTPRNITYRHPKPIHKLNPRETQLDNTSLMRMAQMPITCIFPRGMIIGAILEATFFELSISTTYTNETRT